MVVTGTDCCGFSDFNSTPVPTFDADVVTFDADVATFLASC